MPLNPNELRDLPTEPNRAQIRPRDIYRCTREEAVKFVRDSGYRIVGFRLHQGPEWCLHPNGNMITSYPTIKPGYEYTWEPRLILEKVRRA